MYNYIILILLLGNSKYLSENNFFTISVTFIKCCLMENNAIWWWVQ